MIKVTLAGQYPAHTFERLRELLPENEFSLKAVSDQQEYDRMTDAEVMILRIFKAPKEVIERNPNLKMILRWGAGFDSVDIEAAGVRTGGIADAGGKTQIAMSFYQPRTGSVEQEPVYQQFLHTE